MSLDLHISVSLIRAGGLAAAVVAGVGNCLAEDAAARGAAREAFESAEALHASIAAEKWDISAVVLQRASWRRAQATVGRGGLEGGGGGKNRLSQPRCRARPIGGATVVPHGVIAACALPRTPRRSARR